jgi:hypothetical protein
MPKGMGCVATLLLSALGDPPDGLAKESAEARFLANTRQLRFAGKRSGEGYFSADGRKITWRRFVKMAPPPRST